MTDRRISKDRASNNDAALSTSASLIERIRRFDPEGWRRFMHLYGPLMRQWCRRFGLQQVDTDDVAQEVMIAVRRGIGAFQPRVAGSFRGWLWTITKNKFLELARRRRREPRTFGGSDDLDRLAQIDADESALSDGGMEASDGLYRRAIELVRSEFEEPTWQAFWMTTIDERSPAEVARELEISCNAVYLARSRVLRRLREELGEIDVS